MHVASLPGPSLKGEVSAGWPQRVPGGLLLLQSWTSSGTLHGGKAASLLPQGSFTTSLINHPTLLGGGHFTAAYVGEGWFNSQR